MSKGDLNTFRTEGGNGTLVVNDANVHIVDFETIQITAQTIILALKIGGIDVTINNITTPANPIDSGTMTAPYGSSFSEIQLVSGQAILGLK